MSSKVLKLTNVKKLEFYEGRGLTTENSSFAVGWKNDHAQEIRFKKLCELFESEPGFFSINDLGCGLGHFHDYLISNDYRNVGYVGYDVLDKMILEAKKISRSGRSKFELIDEAQEMKMADFTVCSGIFNLKFDQPVEVWRKYIADTLDVMNEKSEKGFAFNALTSYADEDRKSEELFYSNPSQLFEYCLKNFSKNVSLLHDYHQHDFTILVRK